MRVVIFLTVVYTNRLVAERVCVCAHALARERERDGSLFLFLNCFRRERERERERGLLFAKERGKAAEHF